eukprot:3755883-Rhodomonas_salina.3
MLSVTLCAVALSYLIGELCDRGTSLLYCPTRLLRHLRYCPTPTTTPCLVLTSASVRNWRWLCCYAMPGTIVGYAATPFPVLTSAMLLPADPTPARLADAIL